MKEFKSTLRFLTGPHFFCGECRQDQIETRCVCEKPMPHNGLFFFFFFFFFARTVTLRFDIDLDRWLELETNKKILLQGILMWNMKALILANQKVWPMLKFLRTNKRKNGRTKNYMPTIYRCGRHTNVQSDLWSTLFDKEIFSSKYFWNVNNRSLIFPWKFLGQDTSKPRASTDKPGK